jgi:hypothetical protein
MEELYIIDGQQVYVNKEQLREDDTNDLKDRWWRLNNLYYIVNQRKEFVLFKPNEAQSDLYWQCHDKEGKRIYESIIVLKSRQLGFTTFFSIYGLDEALFVENTKALFIANKVDVAEDIFENKVKRSWNAFKLAPLYRVDTNKANQLKFTFPNGSESELKVDTSGRASTISFLHISELAKLFTMLPERAKEVVTGSFPAVPAGGFKVVESTAEGDYGLFRDMYWNAVDIEPQTNKDFKTFFYNWRWDFQQLKETKIVPLLNMKESARFGEYQKIHNLTDLELSYYYERWKDQQQDWNLLRQEYPTTHTEAFVSSGNRFFDTMKLEAQKTIEGEKLAEWTIYEPYKAWKAYSMGVDPAEGIGGDNAAIIIMNVTDGTIAATFFSNKTDPNMLAYEAVRWARTYGMCIMIPERNNHGHAFNLKARDLGYGNIYTEEKKDEYQDKDTKKMGVHMNARTKPTLMYGLKTAVETDLITIQSKRLRDQMIRYPKEDLVEEKTKDEWIGHFDGVPAAALAWWGRTHAFPYRQDEFEEEEYLEDDGHAQVGKNLWNS